ncbi:DUF262 domain-containing protein [Klebsiella pneumoniae]|uniref:DUF262 domain-containing protein n=1 Tax=Klebsiella pneumoniae TaxID=573 RepID=UPI003AAF4A70
MGTQRKLVWSLKEKTALISSMTQQYPIPLLLFVSIDNKREILDGMQRLEALMSFIEQRFSLNGKYFNLDAIALTNNLQKTVVNFNKKSQCYPAKVLH